jgi:hypothetical protein
MKRRSARGAQPLRPLEFRIALLRLLGGTGIPTEPLPNYRDFLGSGPGPLARAVKPVGCSPAPHARPWRALGARQPTAARIGVAAGAGFNLAAPTRSWCVFGRRRCPWRSCSW